MAKTCTHAAVSQMLQQALCHTGPPSVNEQGPLCLSFFLSLLCTTRVNSIVVAGAFGDFWIFQTDHNRR